MFGRFLKPESASLLPLCVNQLLINLFRPSHWSVATHSEKLCIKLHMIDHMIHILAILDYTVSQGGTKNAERCKASLPGYPISFLWICEHDGDLVSDACPVNALQCLSGWTTILDLFTPMWGA